MTQIPTHKSSMNLQPTPVSPDSASLFGKEIVAVSEGLGSLGEKMRELNNDRQTYKAKLAVSEVDNANWMMAASDPDLDTIEERINRNTLDGIEQAASLIKDTQARNAFVQETTLDFNRRSVTLKHHIYSRQSDAAKELLVLNNEDLVKKWKMSTDKNEMMLLKEQSYSLTEDAVKKGYLHGANAQLHLKTLWHSALIDKVSDDAASKPEFAIEELQKGEKGIYAGLAEHERKVLFNKVTKQLETQELENKHVMEIAQNDSELSLIEKFDNNALTFSDINNAQIGIGGIKIRPVFAKALREALEDPFPLASKEEQEMKAYELASDESKDPKNISDEIQKMRLVSPTKAKHIIDTTLRTREYSKLLEVVSDNSIEPNAKKKIIEGMQYITPVQKQSAINRITKEEAGEEFSEKRIQIEENAEIGAEKEKIALAKDKRFNFKQKYQLFRDINKKARAKQYAEALETLGNQEIEPLEAKVDILRKAYLTNKDKSSLLNSGFRYEFDNIELKLKKKSINQLIQEGIEKNKKEIMESDAEYQQKLVLKRKEWDNWLYKIKNLTVNDVSKFEEMQLMTQEYIASTKEKGNSLKDMQDVQKGIIMNYMFRKNPKLRDAKKGYVFMDSLGQKIKFDGENFIEIE